MKQLIFLCIVVGTLISIVNCDDNADMMRGISQECKTKEGATDQDVEDMIAKKVPASKGGKCMISCLQEQFGIVVDMKLSKSGFMDIVRMKVSNDALIAKAEKVADDCAAVTHTDRCELGALLAQCLSDKASAYGVDKDI